MATVKGMVGDIDSTNTATQSQSMSDYVIEAIMNPDVGSWPVLVLLVLLMGGAYQLHTFLDARIEENIKMGRYGNEPEPIEYTKEEFQKDLDQNGPYMKAESALASDSLIKLRPIISKRAYGAFAKRKQELMRMRLTHF